MPKFNRNDKAYYLEELEDIGEVRIIEVWVSGVSKMTLPSTLMVGSGATEGNPVSDLINLFTVEKAKDVANKK